MAHTGRSERYAGDGMRSCSRWSVALGLSLALLASRPARAADDGAHKKGGAAHAKAHKKVDRKAAARLAAEASKELSAEHFGLAARSFERAYDAEPQAAFMWRAAVAHRRQFAIDGKREDLVLAIADYKRFLEHVHGAGAADAEKGAHEAEQQLAALPPEAPAPAAVAVAPVVTTPATVATAPAPVVTPPPAVVAPPVVVAAVPAPAVIAPLPPPAILPPPPVAPVEVATTTPPAGGGLLAPAEDAPLVPVTPPSDYPPAPPRKSIVPGVVLLAAGVALVGAGIALDAVAKSDASAVQGAGTTANPAPFSQWASRDSQGRTFATTGYVLMGVGGAAAIAGAVLLGVELTGRHPKDQSRSSRRLVQRAWLAPSPNGLVAAGVWQ